MVKIMHNNLSLRTWIEISQANLLHNYKIFRKLLNPNCKLMAVTKSNAYGHSLIDYSKAIEALGVDWIGVDSLIEAVKLRENGIEIPILVLGYTFPNMINCAIENNISLNFSNWDSLKALVGHDNINGLKVHLKFDTGMSRQGFFVNQAEKVIFFIKTKLSGIEVQGVYTHFAGVNNPIFPNNTKEQIEKFNYVLKIFKSNNLKVIRHASATSGAIAFSTAQYDMARIGIGLYGMWPSNEVKNIFYNKLQCNKSQHNKLKLKPILTWKTIISEIKILPAGSKIGYNMTKEVKYQTKIAILPIGYWHGYDCGLSNLAYVVIKGSRAKVLGRVSMDMIVIDINNILDVKVGDEVVLLGSSKYICNDKHLHNCEYMHNGKHISNNKYNSFTADDMANIINTSNYEVVTRINPLIKRIYI